MLAWAWDSGIKTCAGTAEMLAMIALRLWNGHLGDGTGSHQPQEPCAWLWTLYSSSCGSGPCLLHVSSATL